MPSTLSGKTVAILVADGFEQIEFTSPKTALEQAGARAVVVSLKSGKVEGWNHHEKGDKFTVDRIVSQVSADEFDALVLPGGVANPDQLRANPDAVKFVHDFFEQHKPVAAICHGPWTLIDAGVANGRRMTSYHSIKQDLLNAGADWVAEEEVADNGLVTSRSPADLGAFNRKMVEEIAEGVHAGQHA